MHRLQLRHGEVRLDERMDDLMDERAAPGADVHDQRIEAGAVEPVGGVRLDVEQLLVDGSA